MPSEFKAMDSNQLEELLGSSIDRKNIELAKTLFSLRHDLDIHCLIGVNASQINRLPGMTPNTRRFDRRLIDRCLRALEDAVRRSRTEDVRYTSGVGAPLSFLEQLAVDKKPLERFSKALENFDADPAKAEARCAELTAALGEIKRMFV
jgi:hypothetical protein